MRSLDTPTLDLSHLRELELSQENPGAGFAMAALDTTAAVVAGLYVVSRFFARRRR